MAALVLLAGCGGKEQPAQPPPSPESATPEPTTAAVPTVPDDLNVVWILLDACRPDHLSAYGYERETSPNIDAVAARGTLFENHFAQGPSTLISVPSYMTGRHYPVTYQDKRHLGVWFLKQPPADEKLVSSIFNENNFHTCMFSASPWYSPESRLGSSFDEFFWLMYGPHARMDVSYPERESGLFGWLDRNAQAQFFLYIHMLDTHEPRYQNNTATTWLDPAFPAERDAELRTWKGDSFSQADQQHLVDLYDGGVAFADFAVGEILAALDRHGIADRTLVVISSDHGEALAQDGQTLGHPQTESFDDLLKTPLIIAGPGVPAGKRVSIRTENADIVPTLVELAGMETTAVFDGTSLAEAMRATHPAQIRDHAFAKTAAFTFNSEPNKIFIFDDYKFDFGPYNAAELEYVRMPPRPQDLVYAMPDAVGSRHETDPDPEVLARARQVAAIKDMQWQALDARPVEVPNYFETEPGDSLENKEVVDELDFEDNLWTRYREPYLFRSKESQLLVSDPSTEDATGLVMIIKVPSGEYHVSAYTKTLDIGDSPRGSSFRLLRYLPEGKGESDYRLFKIPPPEPGETNEKWFEIGTYSIDDGKFVYFLDEGDPEDLAVIGAFRFVKVGHEDEVPSAEASEEELARIRALGYMDN
jgi:arylsulfatase A-like enzyme